MMSLNSGNLPSKSPRIAFARAETVRDCRDLRRVACEAMFAAASKGVAALAAAVVFQVLGGLLKQKTA